MKKLMILVSFCFAFFNIQAQTLFVVKGTVVADATGLPMAAASIFAQNTTIGTVTDTEGNFTIYLPNGGHDLIISYTGYKTEQRRVSSSDNGDKLIIKLAEKEKELEAVSIVSSNEVKDGLEKYGSFFKDEFIGKSQAGKNCVIQNPEVLHFFFSKRKNRLKITATENLIIKNIELGYNIKYALDSFTHEYNNEVSTFTGYPLYENMEGDSLQMIQWKTARVNAYKGSTLHFMRSLYYKTLKEEKFDVQFIVNAYGKNEGLKLKDIYSALDYSKDDSTQTVEILPNNNVLGILYLSTKPNKQYCLENPAEPKDFKFSMFTIKPKESIVIEQNGYYYDQNDVTISGYWSWEKIADQLPYDFYE